MIVVDLGCLPHGTDVSIEPLVKRFCPDHLFGFDPLLEMPTNYFYGSTRIALEPTAAWVYDGEVKLGVGSWAGGIDATVMATKNGRDEWSEERVVRCFDLAKFIEVGAKERIVVKMDVEGAEFPLLAHLIAAKADHLIDTLLVEWHTEKAGYSEEHRETLIRELACDVEEWA